MIDGICEEFRYGSFPEGLILKLSTMHLLTSDLIASSRVII
jgi:hypothetical protein